MGDGHKETVVAPLTGADWKTEAERDSKNEGMTPLIVSTVHFNTALMLLGRSRAVSQHQRDDGKLSPGFVPWQQAIIGRTAPQSPWLVKHQTWMVPGEWP